jgi:hypothetical protein
MPAFFDTLLYTLVAPIFPDPVLVMSLFAKNLVISLPKGIDPIK